VVQFFSEGVQTLLGTPLSGVLLACGVPMLRFRGAFRVGFGAQTSNPFWEMPLLSFNDLR